MADLSLYLLGSSQVKLDDQHIEVKPRKALMLLIYLAVTADCHARDALATLLWPDSDQRKARHALRNRLSELKRILGGDWIEADRESVGLRAGYWLDVAEFLQLLAEDAGDPQTLTAAAALYRDDFLTGFTLPDCPQFDEWQFYQTENLRQALASALEKLVGTLSDRGDYETAVPHARRRLALDPLHEPACRQLMLLYARSGQQSAALRQYDLCRQSLEEELGVSPSEETTALFNDIQAGTVGSRALRSRPRHNLPTQTTSFIGREAELAEIKRLLLDEEDCRLLNLAGPGGIGKTRLALATAVNTLDAFADGAYFVSLAPVGEVDDLVPAIAEALRFSFFGQTDPKDQLLRFLSRKQLLLVLDNFEHLLDGMDLLADISSHASEVTLLVTSRERLNLQEEWVYEVQGLSFPAGDGQTSEVFESELLLNADSKTSKVLSSYSAVELFTQRARQTTAGFSPSAAEMADIGRICQLVEGMPLGLELAAPWIKVLSCREIAAEIERSLDFLASPLQNVQERHRSLRVVFEQTWERLAPAEQAVLQQLSVFRGGCTREAAEQVTGATLPILSSLVDKALLRRTNTGRYELHELIRQFAAAQLQSDSQATEQTRQQHRGFFIAFLERRTAGVKGHRQLETLAEIEADIDNVRLAWRGAVAIRESEAIERSAACLFVYYLYRNGYDEGLSEFRRAVEAFASPQAGQESDGSLTDLAIPKEEENLVGYLLAAQGYFLAHRRDLQKGQKLMEQALVLLRRTAPVDHRNEAFTLLWLGWAHLFRGQRTEGKRCAGGSLALFSDTDDRWGEAWAQLLLGVCIKDGRPAEAAENFQAGLDLCRDSGDQNVLSYLNHNIGWANKELGRYKQAQRQIDQAVTISEKLDNMLGLGYSLFGRGRLEIALGKYRQAIQTLEQSLTYFNKVGTVHASRAQIYLGLAHHLQGDYELAGQWYSQALEGFKAANSTLELTRCLDCLGRLAHDRGELDEAEQLHRESLALLQEAEQEPLLVADTTRYLGRVMVAMGEGRRAEALDFFRQALKLALAHQLAPIALDVCASVAQLLAQEGELERAVQLLALAERHESGTFETRQKAQEQMAEWMKQLPPDATHAVKTRQQIGDLWVVVQELLAGLTVDET